MMELAFAGFLAGMAGLAVPVILHFLKHRPTQRTPFPSLRFLQATLARRAANNKLRKWIVLLLRCLCLAALVLAFCQPYLPRFAKQPDEVTIVLCDNSFSMQATPHRDMLRNLCLKQVDKADETHPVLLGMVSDKVAWSGKFSGDPAELRAAFNAMDGGEGTSSFENALRIADARLAIMPGKLKRIILVTDSQALPWKTLQWERKLSPGTRLKVLSPTDGRFINAAVTELSLASPYQGADSTASLTVRLENFSDRTMEGTLICLLDGEPAAQDKVTLAPSGETTHTFNLHGAKDHQGVEVRLEVDDDLAVDNRRWIALNKTPLPIVYANPDPSGQTDFLQLAFNPSKPSTSVQWKAWDNTLTPEQVEQADMVIIRDGLSLRTPAGEQLLDTLQQGGSATLIWSDTPEMRALMLRFGVSAKLLPKRQTKGLDFIDFDHPVFKPFLDAQVGGFFNILFYSPPVLELPETAQVLAAFNDGTPAVAEVPVGQGKLLVVASAMDRNHTDWPTHATYLPFWREVMEYGKKDSQADAPLRVSSTPVFMDGLQQATRLGADENITIEQSRLPADKSGNYLLDADTNPRVVSINPPREESDPAQLDANLSWERIISNEPAAKAGLLADQPMDQGRNFWHALFVIALLAALGEMLIANRTVL